MRNSTTTVLSLHQRITDILANRKIAALVTTDQTAAYDLINHSLLEKKLTHIGIKFESVKIIINF